MYRSCSLVLQVQLQVLVLLLLVLLLVLVLLLLLLLLLVLLLVLLLLTRGRSALLSLPRLCSCHDLRGGKGLLQGIRGISTAGRGYSLAWLPSLVQAASCWAASACSVGLGRHERVRGSGRLKR